MPLPLCSDSATRRSGALGAAFLLFDRPDTGQVERFPNFDAAYALSRKRRWGG
jgi:hypothetical protein